MLQPEAQGATVASRKVRFRDDGVLIVDKPAGLTSHEVVQQVKQRLGAAKAGHAGTLDPFATGVLVVLLNRATKLSAFLTQQQKAYRFTVVFGVETDTQDGTGSVVATQNCGPLKKKEIQEACRLLIGEIRLKVPRYSAVRLGGERLYRLARRGVRITEPARPVQIEEFSLCQLRWPEAIFEVSCSKGTYVRSLGAELCRYLKCCGHVSQLRRLRSGWFHLGQAVTLEELDETVRRGEVGRLVIPPARALQGFPEIRVSAEVAWRLSLGATLDSAMLDGSSSWDDWRQGPYKVVDPEARLVAIVARVDNCSDICQKGRVRFKTLRVINPVSGSERLRNRSLPAAWKR